MQPLNSYLNWYEKIIFIDTCKLWIFYWLIGFEFSLKKIKNHSNPLKIFHSITAQESVKMTSTSDTSSPSSTKKLPQYFAAFAGMFNWNYNGS